MIASASVTALSPKERYSTRAFIKYEKTNHKYGNVVKEQSTPRKNNKALECVALRYLKTSLTIRNRTAVSIKQVKKRSIKKASTYIAYLRFSVTLFFRKDVS